MATTKKAKGKAAKLTPAQRAWETRRANGDAGEGARKAWETRRANAAAAAKATKGRKAKGTTTRKGGRK